MLLLDGRPVARDVDDTCTGGGAQFADTEGTTHAAAIACSSDWGLINGYQDGTFWPGLRLTRGQAAALLHRTLSSAGHAVSGGEGTCAGQAGAHGKSVEALVHAGVAPRSTCFSGHVVITRGEMAAWVSATLDVAGGDPGESVDWYVDDDGHAHEGAIQRITAEGIVTGRADGTFGADESLSRGQMATFLTRLLDRLLEL